MKHIAILTLSILASGILLGTHPVKFEMQVLAVDANEGVAVADYDKDGKLDISAGRNWYRNPGKSRVWVPAGSYDHRRKEWLRPLQWRTRLRC